MDIHVCEGKTERGNFDSQRTYVGNSMDHMYPTWGFRVSVSSWISFASDKTYPLDGAL